MSGRSVRLDYDGRKIASTVDNVPCSRCTFGSAAKAGVRMFTQALAVEMWERGIQVNVVLPGIVANGLDPESKFEEARTAAFPPRFTRSECSKHPDRVAELVLWLATRGEDGPICQTFSLARRPL